VREALRVRLDRLNAQWSIVINPRRKALDCPFPEIEREIERLIRRCSEP
jgi:ribonuclease P protein component